MSIAVWIVFAVGCVESLGVIALGVFETSSALRRAGWPSVDAPRTPWLPVTVWQVITLPVLSTLALGVFQHWTLAICVLLPTIHVVRLLLHRDDAGAYGGLYQTFMGWVGRLLLVASTAVLVTLRVSASDAGGPSVVKWYCPLFLALGFALTFAANALVQLLLGTIARTLLRSADGTARKRRNQDTPSAAHVTESDARLIASDLDDVRKEIFATLCSEYRGRFPDLVGDAVAARSFAVTNEVLVVPQPPDLAVSDVSFRKSERTRLLGEPRIKDLAARYLVAKGAWCALGGHPDGAKWLDEAKRLGATYGVPDTIDGIHRLLAGAWIKKRSD